MHRELVLILKILILSNILRRILDALCKVMDLAKADCRLSNCVSLIVSYLHRKLASICQSALIVQCTPAPPRRIWYSMIVSLLALALHHVCFRQSSKVGIACDNLSLPVPCCRENDRVSKAPTLNFSLHRDIGLRRFSSQLFGKWD